MSVVVLRTITGLGPFGPLGSVVVFVGRYVNVCLFSVGLNHRSYARLRGVVGPTHFLSAWRRACLSYNEREGI